MNVVKTGDGRFIEVQGTAEGPPFERRALDDLIALADDGIRDSSSCSGHRRRFAHDRGATLLIATTIRGDA